MEKLPLTDEKDLRIYCFLVRRWPNVQYAPTAPILPDRALFYLGYSIDDVQAGINERFKNMPLEILMYGDIPFREMVEKVNLINSISFGADKFNIEEVRPDQVVKMAEASPEIQRMQFMNNVRLIADKFVEGKDRQVLIDILNRVNLQTKSIL